MVSKLENITDKYILLLNEKLDQAIAIKTAIGMKISGLNMSEKQADEEIFMLKRLLVIVKSERYKEQKNKYRRYDNNKY